MPKNPKIRMVDDKSESLRDLQDGFQKEISKK